MGCAYETTTAAGKATGSKRCIWVQIARPSFAVRCATVDAVTKAVTVGICVEPVHAPIEVDVGTPAHTVFAFDSRRNVIAIVVGIEVVEYAVTIRVRTVRQPRALFAVEQTVVIIVAVRFDSASVDASVALTNVAC